MFRQGYPAYIHGTSQAILRGESSRDAALGLDLEELIAPRRAPVERTQSSRGPIEALELPLGEGAPGRYAVAR